MIITVALCDHKVFRRGKCQGQGFLDLVKDSDSVARGIYDDPDL